MFSPATLLTCAELHPQTTTWSRMRLLLIASYSSLKEFVIRAAFCTLSLSEESLRPSAFGYHQKRRLAITFMHTTNNLRSFIALDLRKDSFNLKV